MNILASLTENVTTFTSILKPLQHKCHFLCRPAYSESLFSLFAVWLFCHCNLLWGETMSGICMCLIFVCFIKDVLGIKHKKAFSL